MLFRENRWRLLAGLLLFVGFLSEETGAPQGADIELFNVERHAHAVNGVINIVIQDPSLFHRQAAGAPLC